MSTKVSVVVPVYNVEEYLEKCLDSIVGQTLREINIICVNDGSTDGSLNILRDYAEKDKRITVISKKNGGLSSARNAGLKKCNTEYVMFCDSDDYIAPTMCEKMLSVIEKDDSDLAVCTQNVIYLTHDEMKRSDRSYYRLNYTGKQYIHDELIIGTDVSVLNKIFRMDIIRENNISFPEGLNNEDFYFYNAYMSVSRSISFVNQRLYNYIRRDGSIMSENFRAEKLSMDHLLVAEKLFDFYKKNGYLNKHRDLFWQQWLMSFWFSVDHSSSKYRKEIFEHAREFIRTHYDGCEPSEKDLRRGVEYVLDGDKTNKIWNRVSNGVRKLFWKFNPRYRQQNYINAELWRMIAKSEELQERLENLKGAVEK